MNTIKEILALEWNSEVQEACKYECMEILTTAIDLYEMIRDDMTEEQCGKIHETLENLRYQFEEWQTDIASKLELEAEAQ
jgi:hypothetical protein